MKNKKFLFILYILLCIATVAAVSYTISFAGSLAPSAVPQVTFYTLDDIYNKLVNNISAGSHSISTSTTPSSTFHTLSDIYNAIPNGAGNPNITGPFTYNGNETITDAHTRLIWQSGNGGARTWQSAKNYCENLSLAGQNNWRLPTIAEWESVLDRSRYNPASALPGASGDEWSSTESAHDSNYAWVAYMYNGIVDTDFKTFTYEARCVLP